MSQNKSFFQFSFLYLKNGKYFDKKAKKYKKKMYYQKQVLKNFTTAIEINAFSQIKKNKSSYTCYNCNKKRYILKNNPKP